MKRKIVYEHSRGLAFRNGRIVGEVGPGRYWVGRGREIVAYYVIPQALTVASQEVSTADGYMPRVTGSVTYRLVDLRAAWAARSDGHTELLKLEIQIMLRDLVGERTLDDLLGAPRGALDEALATSLAPVCAGIGAALVSARIREINVPAEVRRMLTAMDRARREGLVALERARAEQAALRSLANAARMLRGNPELQNLRLIQALSGAPGGPAHTVVLGGASGLVKLRPGEAEEGEPT